MTTIVLVPEAVRGGIGFGHAGDAIPTPLQLPAGVIKYVVLTFPSGDWTNTLQAGTLSMCAGFERSLNNGTSWTPYIGTSAVNLIPPGGGGIPVMSLPVSFDGTAMWLRGFVTVNINFSYGVSVSL